VKGCLWQKNTRTWSAVLHSQSYAKETIGIESTGTVKTGRTIWLKNGKELLQFA
jgi:hypothetical protein